MHLTHVARVAQQVQQSVWRIGARNPALNGPKTLPRVVNHERFGHSNHRRRRARDASMKTVQLAELGARGMHGVTTLQIKPRMNFFNWILAKLTIAFPLNEFALKLVHTVTIQTIQRTISHIAVKTNQRSAIAHLAQVTPHFFFKKKVVSNLPQVPLKIFSFFLKM
jgi:hypothetical protein